MSTESSSIGAAPQAGKERSPDLEDDDWAGFSAAMREAGKERRSNNRDSSQLLLAERGIDFTSNNGGAHLIVADSGQTWDFWPGTGKWAKRDNSGKYFRGVFSLLKAIEKSRAAIQRATGEQK